MIRNVLKPLAKSVLVPLGLTSVVSAKDAAMPKKIFGSGTTLIIFDEEINDIKKRVKSFKYAGLLIKGVNKRIKNEAKIKKSRFLGMLLGALAVVERMSF